MFLLAACRAVGSIGFFTNRWRVVYIPLTLRFHLQWHPYYHNGRLGIKRTRSLLCIVCLPDPLRPVPTTYVCALICTWFINSQHNSTCQFCESTTIFNGLGYAVDLLGGFLLRVCHGLATPVDCIVGTYRGTLYSTSLVNSYASTVHKKNTIRLR